MHKQKLTSLAAKILVVVAVATVLTLSLAPQAKNTTTDAERLRLKPDLIIVSLRAEFAGLTAGGSHSVRLTVQVRCSGRFPGSCGPFKIKVEGTDFAFGPYFLVGEAGVASLGTGYASAVAPTETRTFSDTVPSGAIRHYVATVDPTTMVDESNEGNNQASAEYAARGCAGVDLVLTQVEMIRSDSGGVLFHVWVRNRCLEACVGDLYYAVTPVAPGGLAVEQGIGGRLDGETAAGPLGSILASGRSGIDLVYEVSVSVRGGCRETDTTNNTCRVRINAGEDRKTISCRY